MKLLLLNDSFFGNAFQDLGWEVLRVGPGAKNDIVIDPSTRAIGDVIAEAGFRPDAVLQVDSIDQRVFFRGVGELSAPTAFYAVDGPINEFWQREYAHGFDRVYVDQKSCADSWRRAGREWVQWLPLAADPSLFHPPQPGSERDIPLLFVGTLDKNLRPKRSAILFRLRSITEVKVVDGGGLRAEKVENVADLYRRAKVVLNELLFDGINLRTFEAMACGAVVLTEAGRGEEDLFTEGEDLVGFNPTNLERIVSGLLAEPDRIARIGARAAEHVAAGHTILHPAPPLATDLEKFSPRGERFGRRAATEAAWGEWQASWKWPRLNSLRREAEKTLVENISLLDYPRRAELLEARGDAEAAKVMLATSLERQPDNDRAKAALAGLLLAEGNLAGAARVLEMPADSDLASLHVAAGDLLSRAGQDLTAGFNRTAAPVCGWTAFEHYRRAHSLNEDNRCALEGLDHVLLTRHAPEFTVALWQRFHARNPRDEASEITLRRRAVSGYFVPAPVLQKRRIADPFGSSRGGSGRLQSHGRARGGA
ncbi:MAG TPA: hypothetical protein ENI92_08770 [Bacteroidetes bacterium]|nr:hypothetical protein [Bacteroidota bacterium]